MDFINFIDNLRTFFATEYPIYLDNEKLGIEKPDKYIEGFPNYLDGENILFYISPLQFNFEVLASESELLLNDLEIYIIIKNLHKTNNEMNILIKQYANAFYKLVKENYDLGKNVDDCFIKEIQFFDIVENFNNSRALKIVLEIKKEI